MKGTPSFNLAMLNLFVGLVTGNRLLRPVSQEIRNLGYRLHSIEHSFESSSHQVNPEALACSESQQHTLLVEWTQAPRPDERKRQQIIRYTKVTTEDLMNKAAVPPRASRASGTWLVVAPGAAKDYESLVSFCADGRLMLCTFTLGMSQGFSISHEAGALSNTQLSAILSRGIVGRRIPMGFVRVPMDNLQCEEFAEQVIQQIVSFAVKEHLRFSAEEIAEAMFGRWRVLSLRRRLSITKATSHIVREFAGKAYAGSLLVRIKQSPPTWHIARPEWGGLSSVARKLNELGNKYLSRYNPDRPIQLDLPEFESDN